MDDHVARKPGLVLVYVEVRLGRAVHAVFADVTYHADHRQERRIGVAPSDVLSNRVLAGKIVLHKFLTHHDRTRSVEAIHGAVLGTEDTASQQRDAPQLEVICMHVVEDRPRLMSGRVRWTSFDGDVG